MFLFQKFLAPAAVICSAILCCGYHSCDREEVRLYSDPDNWEEMQKEPKYRISIHEVVRTRRGEGTERTVSSYFGGEVCINYLQLLDSSEIPSIQAIPIPGQPNFFKLKLNLTDRGRKLWITLSVMHKGTELAFVVDGMVYRGFIPRILQDDEESTVIIDGPFDQATAMAIQNNSKFNYFKTRK